MKANIWPKKKISWLFDVIGSGTTPSASKEIYYSSPDMAWLNTGDLTDSYVEQTTKYVSKQALKDFSALTVFPKESLVMAMYGATIGKLGITKYETTTNQACCVLGQPKGITTKFTFYWLMGHRSEIINLSQGGGQPNISQGIIRNIRIAVPPLELQNKIVAFIDKKFDETNLLINKKEQMIKLLEQQRQSIITETVTKGLNPNVKMKDSGVEWIGEIPERWYIKKLKYLLREGSEGIKIGPFGSALKLEMMVDEGYKVYGQENLIKDDFTLGKRFINSNLFSELSNYALKEGDVLVSMMGTIGKCKVVPNNFQKGIMDSHLIRMRFVKNKINSNYIALVISNAQYIKEQFNLNNKGSIMSGLNSSIIKSLDIVLPPLEEQNEILEYLMRTLNQIDYVSESITQQISKLKEYRQALIYEAVTGKIDVRDMELD